MELHNPLIKGTFILTVTGLLTRFMGFFYRIFLSHTFGAVQVGLYQLNFPIYALGSVASRLVQGRKKEARQLLYTGLLITLSVSCCFTIFLQKFAPFLAGSVLGDRRCEHLLILLSYVFPFSAIHSCITGYCLGLKDTKIPSSSQLLEQTVRIFSVLVICQFLNHTEGSSGIWIAVLGLIFGEIASALYSLKCVRNKPGLHFLIPSSLSLQQMFSDAKELIKLSLPLTGNRILLNILQSIEAVSIPASLLIYGLSTSDALSTYGVLTGMALPCILFPSALTNSASTMLLPAITEAQTQKNVQRIKKMIRSSLCGCIFLGTGCLAGFFLLGPVLGRLLFHSSFLDVSIFIRQQCTHQHYPWSRKNWHFFLAKYAKSFHSNHWCLIFYSILGNPGIPALPSGKPDIPFRNRDFVYKLSFTPDAFELSLQHIKEC